MATDTLIVLSEAANADRKEGKKDRICNVTISVDQPRLESREAKPLDQRNLSRRLPKEPTSVFIDALPGGIVTSNCEKSSVSEILEFSAILRRLTVFRIH